LRLPLGGRVPGASAQLLPAAASSQAAWEAMELLASIGVAAKELLEYNREIFKFDQEQRLERDLLRLEMQVKRFGLFREDIRDLVELTVGKMEMYHAVGALAIWFCITWYTEGRIRAKEAPPFIVSLYLMSIAGAFVYLLLTVWLSMHASVTSHSIGVRLLTRYVRLPIPGAQQLNALNPKLTDFEGQGAKKILRVPFLAASQEWMNRARGLPTSSTSPPAVGQEDAAKYNPLLQQGGVLKMQDLLGKGEVPLGKESELRLARRQPGKHIQLFRKLQMKWQCYDAYARVCMSLGMNQILMSASFYLICVTVLEYHSPSLCFALIFIFQICSLAMSFLDISGISRLRIIALWFFGSLVPLLWAAVEVTMARSVSDRIKPHQETNGNRTEANTSVSRSLLEALIANESSTNDTASHHGGKDPFQVGNFYAAWVPFFLIAGWMVGLLLVAWPSTDEKTLPRLFRAVLFVDVFALEDDSVTAVTGKNDGKDNPTTSTLTGTGSTSTADPHLRQERAKEADESCYVAEAGLRRWEAVPAGTSEAGTQGAEVARLRRDLNTWRRALNNEAARIAGTHGDMEAVRMLEVDTRTWNELSTEEQAQDPWSETLLGPFEHNTLASHYYYDLEGKQFVWEVPESRDVLTLEELRRCVERAEGQVRAVFNGKDLPNVLPSSAGRGRGSDEDDDDMCPPPPRACCCFRVRGRKPAFVPERLPWFSLSFMTWALVAAWIFQGTFFLLEELHVIIEVDEAKLQHPTHEIHMQEGAGMPVAHRRLAQLAAARWSFSSAEVSWPAGLFFSPEALACLPEPGGALLVGGSDALHWAPMPDPSSTQPMELTALSTPAPLPKGSVALCGAAGKAVLAASEAVVPCLMGAPTAGGVSIWRPGRAASDTVTLPVSGRPWRRLAGATVRCAELAGLALQDFNQSLREDGAWCLLLVGWDGERLPVAALRLPGGPVDAPPAATARISPTFDVPLGAKRAPKEEIVGLHVEPHRGRLWALRSDGGLQAWNLKRPRALGRWQPRWMSQADGVEAPRAFKAAALCEHGPSGRLVVLGRHGVEGPKLLWAEVPEAMERL